MINYQRFIYISYCYIYILKELEAYYYNKTKVDYVRTEKSIINKGKKINLKQELI